MKQTAILLQNHDRLVRARGDIVEHYPARKCTCGAVPPSLARAQDEGTVTKDSLRAAIGCPICKGNGYWWEPVALKFKALVTDVNVKSARELLISGQAGPGDMTLTPPPLALRNYRLNDYDKFVFPHRGAQPHDGDVLIRDQYDLKDDFDFTGYRIGLIESVTWHDTNSLTPEIIRCVRKVDYDYTPNTNRIVWLDGPNVPPQGMAFHVGYRAYYEWIGWVSPYIRVENANLLGPRVVLKKKHLIGMV